MFFLNKYIFDFKNCYFDFKVNVNDNNYKKNLSKVKFILENMREIKFSFFFVVNLFFISLLFEFLFELYINFKIFVGNKNMKKIVFDLLKFELVLEYIKINYKMFIFINKIVKVVYL